MEMNNKQVLVTGVNGFVGPHVVRELLQRGCEVEGVGYGPNSPDAPKNESYTYIDCNLTNFDDVKSRIGINNLRAIIHLAGLSSPAISFEQPQRYIADNSAMLINLFEAVLQNHPEKLPRFVVISSGAIYDSNQTMPLTEESRIAYNSPYTVSKVTNEHIAEYYHTRGFETITIRPFNHIGPGQGPGFLIPDLAAQVMAAGNHGTIAVGNLETRRDYSDVRDVVRAYADVALAGILKQRLFNISSGKSYSGKEILTLITKAVLGDAGQPTITTDPQKVRPNDPPEIFGDHARATQDFGWQPVIPIETTITDYIMWLRRTNKQ